MLATHNSANGGYVDALHSFTSHFCTFVKDQSSILSLDNAALVRFRHKKHISCCVATKQVSDCPDVRFCRHQIHLEWFLRLITNTWFCHLEQVCKCSSVSGFCRHKYIREKCPDIFSKTPSSVATNRPANVLMSHHQHLFFCH